jgi:predicted homoserine dehydrogenase-like protein
MNLYRLLQKRAANGKPVRVGLIGAGKFGSMFLSQVPTTPGLEVAAIADLSPSGRARRVVRLAGPRHGSTPPVSWTMRRR